MRRIAVALLFGSLAMAGCRAVPGNIRLDIQNLSPEAITVVTEEPGPFLFADTSTHVIKPWAKGRCNNHLGLYPGHIKVTISGSNIPSARSYDTDAHTEADNIVVSVDPDGNVAFGGTLADDILPCVMDEGP